MEYTSRSGAGLRMARWRCLSAGSCACLESTRPVKILGAVLFAAGRRSGAREASKHSAMRSMPAALGCRPSGSRPCRVLSTVTQKALLEPAQPHGCASIRQSSRLMLAEMPSAKLVRARPCLRAPACTGAHANVCSPMVLLGLSGMCNRAAESAQDKQKVLLHEKCQ